MQDNLLAVLRQATAGQHGRIEFLLRLDEPFGMDRYAAVLQCFEAFLRQWEPAVERALPEDLRGWFRERLRAPMARADLAALGSHPLDGEVGIPQLQDAPEALGSLYVLEGSALGGQVISRQVYSQHGLTPAHGAAYFGGRGSRTGAMWRDFQDVLARHDRPAQRERAGAAAARTFEALIALFARVPHAA